MKCPNCNETLLLSERYSIQIDYCPNCRGIWLDKGELDKMLEYAAHKMDAARIEPQQGFHPERPYGDERRTHDKYGKPYKKKSFLGDLFDFD
ncbi:MAG: hypothetical protein EOP49_01910 [Sphingobacteriales bacterium]|nr:MAG: hypothetical protein EOP49_01910 [Sphingobacteriales bacterium]